MSAATRLDESIEVTADDVKQALRPVPNFAYGGELPIGETWTLGPTIEHRDSGLCDKSNAVALRRYLNTLPELADDWEITDCSHWAVGWVKHLSYRVVDSEGKPSRMARIVKAWFKALDDYPIADEYLHTEMEQEEANQVWTTCYSDAERLEIIRKHRHEFEFHSFADLLGCVRGKYFAGYPSTILE